jgi:hypothetical protein
MRQGIANAGDTSGAALVGPKDTFKEQREFILAEDRRLTLCTPRRAAKSESLLRKMLRTMLRHPRSIIPYVSMDRETSKRNVWDRLQELGDRYKLKLEFNHSELIARHTPTGGQIEVTGLATKKEIGKLRGRKYPMLAADEVQDILIDFEGFIMSVVLPALGDVRGQLVLAGTPDPFRRQAFWYQVVCSDHPRWQRWKRFGWPLTANTFFKEPEKWLKAVREEEGYAEDDPRYQAEYLGLWTASKTNLCIDGYETPRNDFHGDPTQVLAEYPCVLGLDPGYQDSTGFVVACYSVKKRHVVIVESWAKRKMIMSDIAAAVISLCDKYPIIQVACDEAKMGKHISRELAEHYNLPVVAAEKIDKRQRLAFMNADLRTGRLQVVAGTNRDLIEQWGSVLWDREHQREAEGQVCDLFDAAGYAHMQCRSYFEAEEVAKQDEGERYWEDDLERARQGTAPDPQDWTRESL